MMYGDAREGLCIVVKKMFDRFMTNAAGGNISVKVDNNKFIMTPTLMSQNKFCDLKPEEILVINNKGEIIDGEGKVTREFNMHMAVYENSPNCSAVIHAHPKESMVFASLGIPLPSLTECTEKLGTITTLPFAPATTIELANNIETFLKHENDKFPFAVLLRSHGILIADKTLHKAYDLLERIEYNAYVNMQSKIIKVLDLLEDSTLTVNTK